MQIEDMTVEQILQHLQERKTIAPKLGGVLKQAAALKKGEICWVQMKVVAQNMSSVALDSPTQPGFQMEIHPSRLVETNVPEQRRARLRMTAGEAAQELEVGQEVWVKCSVSLCDPKDKHQPLRVAFDYLGSHRFLLTETQIEVEA